MKTLIDVNQNVYSVVLCQDGSIEVLTCIVGPWEGICKYLAIGIMKDDSNRNWNVQVSKWIDQCFPVYTYAFTGSYGTTEQVGCVSARRIIFWVSQRRNIPNNTRPPYKLMEYKPAPTAVVGGRNMVPENNLFINLQPVLEFQHYKLK